MIDKQWALTVGVLQDLTRATIMMDKQGLTRATIMMDKQGLTRATITMVKQGALTVGV